MILKICENVPIENLNKDNSWNFLPLKYLPYGICMYQPFLVLHAISTSVIMQAKKIHNSCNID